MNARVKLENTNIKWRISRPLALPQLAKVGH
jgi:hypothetical protein